MLLECSNILICLVLFFFIILWYRWRRPSNYPPGPTPLPVIGNLHHLDGTDIVQSFRSLRRQHGDVFSLSLGKFWVVVVNGADNLKELLVRKGDKTSDRPDLYAITVVPVPGVMTESGDLWQQRRSYTLSILKEFGFGKRTFESHVVDEIDIFIKHVENFNGEPFDLQDVIHSSTSNVMMSIVLGKRYEYDDVIYRNLLESLDRNLKDPVFKGIVNFNPFLAYIPGDPFRASPVRKNLQDTADYFKQVINEHRATLDDNNVRDFIDACLVDAKSGKNALTDGVLAAIILDLFSAGSETTATVIRWALLYLTQNPEIQEIMWTEIDDVVGSGRSPSTKDKLNLPFCEAVILESLRLGNVVPLSLPHKATVDIQYKDFIIPQGSVIIPCLDSVVHDENLFPESHKFKPERFLNEKHCLNGHDSFLAFSLGKRVCLGEALARMELFLYITALVQRFKFLPPANEDPPTSEGCLGITYGPLPFKLRDIPRS